jgi:hypothetical protein
MSKTILFLVLLTGTLFAFIGGGTTDNDDDNVGDLVAELSSDCEINVVTVNDSKGDPVGNASVDVFNEFNLNQILDDELTDENGTVFFDGCGQEVRIIATKNDYKTYTFIRNLIDCRECGCIENSDCPGTAECVDGTCEEIECCGVVKNHTCIPDECGSGERCGSCPEDGVCVDRVCLDKCSKDGDCTHGENCKDGACVPKPQCEDNDDCKDNEQCVEISEGLMVCSAIGGCCGIIANHSCTAYECGTGENCMSCSNRSFCIEHECVELDISPKVINDTIEIAMPPACPDCIISAIAPDGNASNHTTDSMGLVRIPVRMSGIYVVALMSDDGRLFVKKDVIVSIFAEPEKDFFRMILESPWFWLLVLVLLIATVIIYRRFHEDNERHIKKK